MKNLLDGFTFHIYKCRFDLELTPINSFIKFGTEYVLQNKTIFVAVLKFFDDRFRFCF